MQAGVPLFPEQASSVAQSVDYLYLFLNVMTAFFTIGIAGFILFFAVKYRYRAGRVAEKTPHGSLLLEMSWIAIPALIMLIPFFWGASIYFKISSPPANTMDVYVIGKQWMWKVQYLGGEREINQLHVPVGRDEIGRASCRERV